MLSLFKTNLFQNNQSKVNESSIPIFRVILGMGLILWLSMFASTSSAFARSYDNSLRKSVTYKAELGELTDLSNPRLDWRNPKVHVSFELPASDWVDSVDLHLSVHAENHPNKGVPLYIHFNDAPAMPVYPKGHSFTARITLDKAFIKARRNVVGLSYSKVGGCIEPSDGSWTIDLDDSLLLVKSTTPSTTFDIGDVKEILSSSLSAPSKVSIVAKGSHKVTYEALIAQGTALNMTKLPRFSVTADSGDMEIYAGTRQSLSGLLKNTDIENMTGAVIGVTRNEPLRLILTADTEEQLLDLVKSYASYEMPASGKSVSTKSQFVWQKDFSENHKSVAGKTPIYDIEYLNFARGWGDNVQTVEFDIDNPITAHGTTKMYFQRGENVAPSSTVNIDLNGQSLGIVPLSHKRNIVQFDIPRGMLQGSNNRLSIQPDLTPAKSGTACSSGSVPQFFMEDRSYINVKNETEGYAGDLTRFTASAYPFSQGAGQDTNIVLSGTYNSDRTASLRVLARLAKAYGSGLTQADYFVLGTEPTNENKHTPLIGPKLDGAAPRGLASLIDGRLQKPKIIQTASLDIMPISLSAVREGGVVSGGLAAVYEDKTHIGRLRGYVTSSNGHSFNRAVESLLGNNHWNELQGSLARWNRDKVEMAKTAFNANIVVPAPPKVSKGFEAPRFDIPEVQMPRVDFSPVQARLGSAGQSVLTGIVKTWNDLSQKVTHAMAPAPQPGIQAVPVQHDAQIRPVEVNNTDTAKKYNLAQYNYKPKRAPELRKPVVNVTPAGVTEIKSPPMDDLKSKVSLMYQQAATGLDRFINRNKNSVFQDEYSNSPQANVLLIALFLMMFLLVMGLARPRG